MNCGGLLFASFHKKLKYLFSKLKSKDMLIPFIAMILAIIIVVAFIVVNNKKKDKGNRPEA